MAVLIRSLEMWKSYINIMSLYTRLEQCQVWMSFGIPITCATQIPRDNWRGFVCVWGPPQLSHSSNALCFFRHTWSDTGLEHTAYTRLTGQWADSEAGLWREQDYWGTPELPRGIFAFPVQSRLELLVQLLCISFWICLPRCVTHTQFIASLSSLDRIVCCSPYSHPFPNSFPPVLSHRSLTVPGSAGSVTFELTLNQLLHAKIQSFLVICCSLQLHHHYSTPVSEPWASLHPSCIVFVASFAHICWKPGQASFSARQLYLDWPEGLGSLCCCLQEPV